MTITKIAIIPPKTAPKMAAVLSLPDGESVPPGEAVASVGMSAGVEGLMEGGSIVGGCVTISPVKESKSLVTLVLEIFVSNIFWILISYKFFLQTYSIKKIKS